MLAEERGGGKEMTDASYAVKRRWRGRSKIEAIIVVILVCALSVCAYLYRGTPHADVNMHDGGIWVTNQRESLVAHLNYESHTLDAGFNPVSTKFDLSQEANDVILADTAGADFKPVDTAMVQLAEPVAEGLQMAHGENLVLISDAKKRKLWAVDYSLLSSFNAESEQALAVKNAVAMAVTPDDHGFAVDAQGGVWEIELGQEKPVVREAGAFAEAPSEAVQFTAIGEQPVMYQNGTLYTLDGEYPLKNVGENTLVQKPSRDAQYAALADSARLFMVSLSSGDVEEINSAGEGVPAAPVMVNDCAYSAWAGTGSFIKECTNDALNVSLENERLAAMNEPVLRTSRSTVVINDANGMVLLPDQGMLAVDNWDIIKRQIQDAEKENQEEQESDQQNLIDEQQPPVAVDDDLGARVGTSTTLPVVANDTDPNGDVLTAVLKNVPSGVNVRPSDGGRALQIDLDAQQTAPVSFTYKAFDGVAESENEATVRVTPKADTENTAPQLLRARTIQLTEGASVTYSVLPDWIDPEGDPIFLAAATADESLDINFRADGFLSIRDTGTAGSGNREVNVTVSDGKAEANGVIPVKVSSASTNVPPVLYADFYTVNVGSTVDILPLSNDYDPNGSALKLTRVSDPQADETMSVDYDQGRVSFSSTRAGAHIFTYDAGDGVNNVTSKIRVDVIDPHAGASPTAQNDITLLPEGDSATVRVLDNDSDPSGKVLVVQSVDVPADSGITVEIINHEYLLVSAPAGFTQSQTFRYTISNGSLTATAQVLVVPQPPKETNVPPVATDDTGVVRAKDIVDIPVLANDYSPAGLKLTIDPQVTIRSGAEFGKAFVAGDSLRFKAGNKAGSAQILYTIRDEAGNVDSALVNVTVRSIDSGNRAPSPKPVVARAFAGQEIVIPIPLAGADPDGDTVELAQDSSKGPSLGSIVIEEGSIRYMAQQNASGTDTFTYKVKDRFKATGEATVQVGIAPLPSMNQLPVAVPDEVHVKPHRLIDIPVTENDIDSDGDKISLVAGSIQSISEWEPDFSLDGNRVVLTSPKAPGTYQFSYDITDGGGVSVTGFVSLIVDSNMEPQSPIARDDRVRLADIVSRKEVSVPVLDNDSDPDGAVSKLKLEVESPGSVQGSNVVVPVSEQYQVVLYTITDVDGLSSSAAIFVPGVDGVPPMLDPSKIPAQATGAHSLTVDLNDYVIVRKGRTPKLTAASKVSVANGGSKDLPNNGIAVSGDSVIEFTPDKDFGGSTSITFEVHDGSTLEDPEGLRATLSLPVQVTPAVKTPPRVRPSAITVEPGEEAVTADLAGMVTDPDEGDMEQMSYSLSEASKDFDVSIKGSTISVNTDVDTPVGTTGTAVVQVEDHSTDPVLMTIPLSVVPSNRPLMMITELKETEARVDNTETFDVLSAITNPFADKKGEITISDAKLVSGPEADVKLTDTQLSITPKDVGTVVVTYKATDATKAKEREVVGTVRLTVKDKPSAPKAVTARSDASRTAVVDFTQGDLRGGSLEKFIVRWAGGEQDCGLDTNCQITGLTNGTTYNFTVVQVTEVGESEPSAPASARPDIMPDAPTGVSVTSGDGKLTVSWNPAHNEGSPIKEYKVRISPSSNDGGKTEFSSPSTSIDINNLTNGVVYTVYVRAINDYANGNAARESEFKESSGVSGKPVGSVRGISAPKLTINSDSNGVSDGTLNLTGLSIDKNGGEKILKYRVIKNNSGCDDYLAEVDASTPSVTISASTVGTVKGIAKGEVTAFQVCALNENTAQAWGTPSDPSQSIQIFSAPGAPRNVKLTANNHSGSGNATITFEEPDLAAAGLSSGQVTYTCISSGAPCYGNRPVTNEEVISGFSDGVSTSLMIRTIATASGVTVQGGSATSNAVQTYGQPVLVFDGVNETVHDEKPAAEFSWHVSPWGWSSLKDYDVSVSSGPNCGVVTLPISYSKHFDPRTGYLKVTVWLPGKHVCVHPWVENGKGESSSSKLPSENRDRQTYDIPSE